jgi:DDE family transposase
MNLRPRTSATSADVLFNNLGYSRPAGKTRICGRVPNKGTLSGSVINLIARPRLSKLLVYKPTVPWLRTIGAPTTRTWSLQSRKLLHHFKHAMRFRQFLLRGKAKVSGEWQLVSLAYNLKRMASLAAA